jgi:hypothetical protein
MLEDPLCDNGFCDSGSSPPLAPEPFVSAEVVAEFLSLTRRRVLEMTRTGSIPAHPLPFGDQRRVWRYKITEVNAAISSSTNKAHSSNPRGVLVKMHSQRTISAGSPHSQRRKSNG